MATLSVNIDPSGASRGARQVKRDMSDIKRSAGEVERGTDRVGRAANDNFRRMARGIEPVRAGFERLRTTVLGVAGVIASFGAGAFAALNQFAQFEQGLIGVGKTADIAGVELAALGGDIQMIAREVPTATTELLAIAQAAGQLGVKGNDNILAFTETVGKLGLASDLAGEQAATSLARILTVTGTAISDVDRLGSTMVRLGNNFAATESEIAGATTRVAQATAQFGATAADVTGIGAALTAVGVRAEAGGTVIGRAFQSINDAVRNGGEELQALTQITGKSAKALQQLFREDPTRAFQALVEGLGRINAQGGDVTSALESVGLEGVRVVQVLGTLAKRSDVLGDALGQANDEWQRNSALNEEAARAAEAFNAQWQVMKNAIAEVATAVGSRLAPFFVTLMQVGTAALHAIADNMETITKVTKIAGAALLVAFGPTILAMIASGFVALGSAAVGAIGAITAVIAANPLGALAVGITVAITAAYQFRDEIKEIIGVDVVGEVKNAANRIIGAFVGGYNAVVDAWGNLPTFFSAIGKQAWNNLVSEFEKPALTVNGMEIIPGLDLSGMKSSLTDAEQSAFGGASASFSQGFLRDYIGSLGEVRESTKSVDEATKELNDTLSRLGGTGSGAATGAAGGPQNIIPGEGGTLTKVDEGFQKVRASGQSFVDAFSSGLRGLIDGTMSLGDALGGLLSTFVGIASNSAFKALFGGGGSGFMQGLSGGGPDFGGLMSGSVSGVQSYIASALGTALDLGTSWIFDLFGHGAAFQHGRVTPFAAGGLVNQPTLFPMANGMGLMGEAGPEAVMPLKRMPGGQLGVQAIVPGLQEMFAGMTRSAANDGGAPGGSGSHQAPQINLTLGDGPFSRREIQRLIEDINEALRNGSKLGASAA